LKLLPPTRKGGYDQYPEIGPVAGIHFRPNPDIDGGDGLSELVEDGNVVTAKVVVEIIGLLGAKDTVVVGFLFKMFGVAGLSTLGADPAGIRVIKRVVLFSLEPRGFGDSTLKLTMLLVNFFVKGGVVE